MGLFSRGKGGGIDFGRVLDGFSAAQATLAGDYGGAAQIHQNRARTRALEAQALREAEEARMERQADLQRQVALEQLGYSKAEIMAMTGADASQLVREQRSPFTLAPESERHNPGIGGQPGSVTRAAPATPSDGRLAIAAGLQPGTPEYEAAMRDILRNRQRGIVMINGVPHMMPSAGDDEDEWEYSSPGGPTPSASGNFPY